MKTSNSIEEQGERKAARGDKDSEPAQSLRESTQPVTLKHKRGDASYSARIAAWKWKPGHCPNPGGRPKHDLASEIAKAVFENNAEALYKAYCKAALKGNAYAFKELADRAYGKLKERHEVEVSPYKDFSEAELRSRVKQLEKELGVLPAHFDQDDTPKPSQADSDDSKPN